MAAKIIAWLEQNVEKIVLGGCGLFALALAWMFLLNSPNATDYSGQTVGPGEINQRILGDAQSLDQALRNAKPEPTESESFAERLKKSFEGGVAAAPGAGPLVSSELRVVTPFGTPIQVPGLDETQEAPGSVKVVTPLAPSRPLAITGRSMVYKTPLSLAAAAPADTPGRPPGAPGAPSAAQPQASELPWVTVAAFYDKKAQYQEMTKAGYAAYRARPYVVAVEVERQEMQSSGEWLDWQPVQSGDAMPRLDVPAPQVDEAGGKLLNKQELDAAFRTIKAEQARITQPPFFAVEAGDPWAVPPLPGLKKPAGEATPGVGGPGGPGGPVPPGPGAPVPPDRGDGRGPVPPPPTPGPGPGPRDGGRGGGGVGGGGGQNRQAQEAELRKQVNDELKKAQDAIRAKQYAEAIRVAEAVKTNANAKRPQQTRADKLIRLAQNRLAKAAGRSGFVDRNTMPPQQVEHEETRVPALWFHDDTVESGKTYRYRMRVVLWNRYVGQGRVLADAAVAREALLRGEWSAPSAAVTVTPTTHFFVKGGAPGGGSVKFDVWKWRDGNWIQQGFDVAVGDVIGGSSKVKVDEDDNLKPVYADVDFTTGAVVLDVRTDRVRARIPGDDSFSYREQPSVVVVYLDPADGQVKEKSQAGDKDDPILTALEEEQG